MIKVKEARKVHGQKVALIVDQYIVGIYSCLVQHGAEQRYFVLAVTVAIREYLSGRVRLISTDANLDPYIADIMLYIRRRSPDLFERIGNTGNQFPRFVSDFRRNVTTARSQSCIQLADLGPRRGNPPRGSRIFRSEQDP